MLIHSSVFLILCTMLNMPNTKNRSVGLSQQTHLQL